MLLYQRNSQQVTELMQHHAAVSVTEWFAPKSGSAIGSSKITTGCVISIWETISRDASWWSRTSCDGWIATKHGYARAVLGSSERHHVLPSGILEELQS